MAKDGKNAGVSVLVLIGSLLYLYVAYVAFGAVGGVSATSVIGAAAAVLWAIALVASIGLLFGSLGSFGWGWMEQTVNMTMKAGEVAAVALLVVSVAFGGAAWTTWAGIAIVGFILNWLGIAMAWGSMGKK
ncbi:MAG: hypothetical protein KGH54_03895 [Candidatus Micrarchaeota archaeon]|nr:hypothetical protein [Candidatus Micrarchaeota archaeon]